MWSWCLMFQRLSLSLSSAVNIMVIVFTCYIYAQSSYLSGRITDHMTQLYSYCLLLFLCTSFSSRHLFEFHSNQPQVYWCKFTQCKLKKSVLDLQHYYLYLTSWFGFVCRCWNQFWKLSWTTLSQKGILLMSLL